MHCSSAESGGLAGDPAGLEAVKCTVPGHQLSLVSLQPDYTKSLCVFGGTPLPLHN